jgi:hypothetical protein
MHLLCFNPCKAPYGPQASRPIPRESSIIFFRQGYGKTGIMNHDAAAM